MTLMVMMWAKARGTAERLPVAAHSIDTAAVAAGSWDRCSTRFRQNAVALLAPGDEALARARLAWLAGAHDLGKVECTFQTQAWSRTPQAFVDVRDALAAAGFPIEVPPHRPDVGNQLALWWRHEAGTGLVLDELECLPAWARRIAMAHHGRFQPSVTGSVPKALVDHRAQMLTGPWRQEQLRLLRELGSAVEQIAGVPVNWDNWIADEGLALWQRLFVLPLAGLVTVCDWIASDTEGPDSFVALAPLDVLRSAGPVAYAAARAASVETVLDAAWGKVNGSRSPGGKFFDLFPGKQPRGVQSWMAARGPVRGLVIACASMGEGKTELSLLRHAQDPDGTGGASDWLYFGLPTMATADAMFDRVNEFWRGLAGIGHLAHSQAALTDFYTPTRITPGDVCDDHIAEGLSPQTWFQGRHRALLAPVTVGTQDQVLAAGLRHKYVTVRHAGLANKHLVLDEVHTYDPYQQRLLVALLEWLGAYKCRVTLLSATLPRARVVELARAYLKGWHGDISAARLDELCGQIPDPFPYPSVTTASDTVAVFPTDPWRRFRLHVDSHLIPAATDNDMESYTAAVADVVRHIRTKQPHARIAVMLNTVDRAIQVYRVLADDPAHGETVVLHSRMLASQRWSHTRRLEQLVGKGAVAGPMLAVTTQVAEASLDLDFDVIVTDLAPIASLMQRSGRLWRHSINEGGGWTHPPHLSYRHQGEPVIHVLVQTNPDRSLVDRSTLPYLAAELAKTWTHAACLWSGRRTTFDMPGDMQAAVDAGNVTWNDLLQSLRVEDATSSDSEPDLHAAVTVALGNQAAQQQKADEVALRVGDASAEWTDTTSGSSPDPFHRVGPDWSKLTWPLLNDTNTVTRLQEVEQARILLCDPTGHTSSAFHGHPENLLAGAVSRNTILSVLSATVPVSGWLACQAKALAPPNWYGEAPAILRDLIPLTVSDLAKFAVLDPTVGLMRRETS